MCNKKSIHVLQGQGQGVIIRRIDFYYAPEVLGMGVSRPITFGPLNVPLGHLSVKGLTIMKLDPLAQSESVNLTICRDFPFGCQTGHKLSLAVDLNQALKNIRKDHPVDGCCRITGGIKSRRFSRLTDNQTPTLDRGICKGWLQRHRDANNHDKKQ